MKLIMLKFRQTNTSFAHMKKLFAAYISASLLFSTCISGFAYAQEVQVPSAPLKNTTSAQTQRDSVSVTVGKTSTYRFKDPVVRISIANPSIADILTVTAADMQLLGKKAGVTNLTIWYKDDRTSTLDVFVGGDSSFLSGLLRELLPSEKGIKITPAGESIVLSGKVSDAEAVVKAVRISEEATGRKVLNMMSTEDLAQVLLEVKIAEMDKTVADNLGISILGTNFSFNMLGGLPSAASTAPTAFSSFGTGSGAANAFLNANITNGLIKILAEPNIMAISGQEGNFLSGGTIYIPVPQSGGVGGTSAITLQAVPYGIGVRFTPTVIGDKINLRVAPQVSDVSPNGYTVSGNGQNYVVPQIKSRNASTTVQLQDGQTFAIGGLISNNVQEQIAAFPWLASLPIIGALFRSSSFQSQRSELIILVTPRIVKPLPVSPPLPTDSYVQPSFSDFFYRGKLQGGPNQQPVVPSQETQNAQ